MPGVPRPDRLPSPALPWQQAEERAAQLMRDWGYRDAKVTGPGSDGGVDVRSRKALAQVKHHAAPVGRPALQQLVGARGRGSAELLFFASAGFTATARVYAGEMGIA